MDNYIRAQLDQRFSEIKNQFNDEIRPAKTSKSVISLAIESYIQENQNTNLPKASKLGDNFARHLIYQLRLFLFAGNDTTSSIIVYVFHLLSQNPSALTILRKEHDDIFGTKPDFAGELLKKQPTLLNKCPFTLAVIKETLHLYPPAATMRAGEPGVTVTDRHGNKYPMDDIGTTLLHPPIHRNPRVWPQPEKFIPERFLEGPNHELHPNPAAFRPFEQGLRNCIGQTLVYNEIRIVIIMTARTFDIRNAYEEWDEIKREQRTGLEKVKIAILGKPVRTVHGDRACQTEKAGTHPADGYPCRVSLRTDEVEN
jgi:cytochrome P450